MQGLIIKNTLTKMGGENDLSSAFLGLFDQWRQTRGDKSLDEFVDYTAQIFEHGISGSHTAQNN